MQRHKLPANAHHWAHATATERLPTATAEAGAPERRVHSALASGIPSPPANQLSGANQVWVSNR
ncbi:MAG TPA: hypothetical protein VHI52_03650, partial [Verrucomicrobiae bacterium]|nr:hypothetical protein [Verrucomicrobiae bacterium]